MGKTFIEIANGFNDAQSEYHVNLIYVPWNSNQKVMSAWAAKMPPDIMYVDRPTSTGWIARDAYKDLTPWVEREGWSTEQFYTISWNDCRFQGRQYMIPLLSDIRCLIYNRKLFREVGLDPDKPPKTWDELYDYSKKLTTWEENGRIKTLGFQHYESSAISNLILVLGWQLGGDLASADLNTITINSPQYLEAMNFILKLQESSGGLDNSLRLLSSGGQSAEGMDSFYLDRVGMKLVESFYFQRQKMIAPNMDTALAPFPTPGDTLPVSWLSGFSLGIPRDAKDPEGAWAFIKYMVSPEIQLRLCKALGILPAIREVGRHPDLYNDPNRRPLLDQMDYSKCYPKTPVNNEAYNEICMAAERVMRGRATPEAALAEAQRRVQELLDADRARAALPYVNWKPIYITGIGISLLSLAAFGYLGVRCVRQRRATLHDLAAGYLFASPWLLGLLIFGIVPLFLSFFYSFCDYEVIQPAHWAGGSNYAKMFSSDPLFWKSLWNTLYYTVFSVPLSMAIALALALLLNQPLKGMRFFRTAFYLPSLITGVAVAVLWSMILGPEYGIVNRVLEYFGIPGPLWFQSPLWSKPALVFMSLWGIGGSMIIFLAGLQGVPRQLYEAAQLDGANAWGQFRHVTVPLITPTIFFVLIVGVIGSFQVFTQAFVVSGGLGGPLDSTLFYVFYIYRKAFEQFQMGYASALAWVLFVVVFILTAIQLWLGKKWVHY